MNRYPAIALIEFSSIAAGILAGDAMVKRAPITVLKSGTVHEGKYLVLLGGSVASVEEAFHEGLAVGEEQVLDRVILPDVHIQVHDAILGSRNPCSEEAIGVIETGSVAAVIRSADAGIKGANVNIVEIRIADDLGGKGIVIFNGKVAEVEAAVEISKGAVTDEKFWLREIIIPRIHTDMAVQIDQTTRFAQVELHQIEDGEI